MPPALAFMLGIALLFVVFLVFGARRERERTEAVRRVAEAAGFSFKPKSDIGAMRALGDIQLFARGHSNRVTNVMSGRVGDQQVVVFDYQFTIGSSKSGRTTLQTVVVLPSANRALPDLQMAPENAVTRLAEGLGFQDIDIESSPEFSRRYIVRGSDEAAIRAALHPGATTYFARHEGWTVEVQAGTVGIYRSNQRPKPEDLRAFIDEACGAARSL